MVYGGVITQAVNVPKYDTLIEGWRKQHNLKAELKWAKVSKAKLGYYIALVDMFFEHAKANRLHFKAVVFDTHQIDYKTYHGGSVELGFYKFYYQFLLYKFGRYAATDDCRLWVYIDERSGCDEVKLGTLRNVLAAGIKNKFGRKSDVVRKIEARDSHHCNLMQLADVLMGAVGFHCNGMHAVQGASPHKIALAAHVAKLANLPALDVSTPYSANAFELWRFQFKGKKRPNP